MTDNEIELSRRKILGATTAVGIAGAGAGLGTSALFSDTEEFANNSITAGTTNLIAEAEVIDVSSGLSNNGTVELTAADDDDGSDDDVLEADGTMVAGLTVGDMKPGDSFIIRTTIEVEDNPMYVAATAASADDSEGVNTEPEISTQSGGTNPDTGGDAVGDGSGDDAGDLDNELLVTFGYDGAQVGNSSNVDRTLDATDGSGNPQITPDPGLGFDGSSSATATSFINSLQGGGLVYRGQASGTASPPGGHANSSAPPTRIGGDVNASNVDREQVTHFIKFELPTSVGNEIQGDSFSFDLGFEAEQVRNNPDPLGGGPTQITSPGLQNNGFGTALDSGSPVVAGEPGFNNDEGRAWILPDSGGSVTQGTELTASQPGDRVGETVAVDGNTAVVGAPGTSGGGQVYVYNKSGGSWSNSPDFALTNADTEFDETSISTFTPDPMSPTPFGSVVDIDGDIIVAGARQLDGFAVGYNAFQRSSDPDTSDWVWIDSFVDFFNFTDVATDSGVGLLTNQDPGFQVFRVFPTQPDPPFDGFGPGIGGGGIPGFGAQGDISSGTVFIGATDKALVYEQTGTQTISGVQIPTYNNAPTASLNPSSGATGVGFGTTSLAAEGSAVAVGAPTEGAGGVTYLYEKTGGSWGQTRRITAPSGASNFGRDLALSSSTLYVGASTSGGGTVYTYSV